MSASRPVTERTMDIVTELRANRSELDSRAAYEIELLRKIVVLGYDDQDRRPAILTEAEWELVKALKRQALTKYERR